MATKEAFAGGTLALVDTNEKTLKTMMRLARRVIGHTKCGVKVVGSTNRRDVLKDSDFVILTFSDRNTHFRAIDTEIAARHGVRMCSSDTIGPGGVFRALREAPHVVSIAKETAKVAPQAWVINLVNPTAVMGMAMRRYAPEAKTFALCDGNHEPRNTLEFCKRVGLVPAEAKVVPQDMLRKIELVIGGVNHCTWLVRFRYDGKDMMPALRQWVVRQAKKEIEEPHWHSKARYNQVYGLELFDLYGYYPTAMGHTKEYVPFYQGYGVAPVKPEPITLFDAAKRASEMAERWQETERYASGKLSVADFIKKTPSDQATDIIESMWAGLGRSFYINAPNSGAVTNLPDDAFLELRRHVDMAGSRPHPFGEMPRGLLALTHQVLDTHELTAEAAMTGDRKALRRALATDPICNNLGDIDAMIPELLKAQRDALPKYWFKR
jgi:alpha-galactosidase